MPKTNRNLAAITLRQTDRRMSQLRKVTFGELPAGGWLRAIRTSLGMTTTQAAQRTGMTQASYLEMEGREATGDITLSRLRSAAAALDCELAYAVIPRDSLAERRGRQAREYATRVVERSSHSMRLEDQGISPQEREAAIAELADELLRSWSARIWDAPGDAS